MFFFSILPLFRHKQQVSTLKPQYISNVFCAILQKDERSKVINSNVVGSLEMNLFVAKGYDS
jgi:hypothetical protein